MKKLILFLALVLTARAGDCVPLALSILAENAGTKVSYEAWSKELMPDGKTSPTVEEAISSWKKHFPDRPLVCVFSSIKSIQAEDRKIECNTPRYLWVGRIPEKMAADPKSDEVHASVLVIVSEDRFKLINMLDPEGKQVLIEYLTAKEFFERTYLVYEVVDPTKP